MVFLTPSFLHVNEHSWDLSKALGVFYVRWAGHKPEAKAVSNDYPNFFTVLRKILVNFSNFAENSPILGFIASKDVVLIDFNFWVVHFEKKHFFHIFFWRVKK